MSEEVELFKGSNSRLRNVDTKMSRRVNINSESRVSVDCHICPGKPNSKLKYVARSDVMVLNQILLLVGFVNVR